MLAERVLVFEEAPGEGFIDHAYAVSSGMTKERLVYP
jgi:hypothetical protein